jgi:hypothetical protein
MKKHYHVVEARFHDHAELKGNTLESLDCIVWGVLIKEDPEYYYIMHWATNCDPNDSETEVWGIKKKALTKPLRRLACTTL